MDRYIKFSWESPMKKFIEDAKDRVWEKEIKKFQRELREITDLAAFTNSEVHSCSPSSPTEKTAMKRLHLERKIARRINYRKIYDTALDNLTEDEKEIFRGFHLSNKYVSLFVDEYSHAHDCSPRHVYTLKREAEKQFCENIQAQQGDYINY